MSVLTSHPSSKKEIRVRDGVNTGQPVLDNRWALDVIAHSTVKQVATDTVDSATTEVITAASHAARVGDLILFTGGTESGRWFVVTSTTTNTITLNSNAGTAPAASDGFTIYRYHPIVLDANGYLQVKTIP